jgi:hypothetical protein
MNHYKQAWLSHAMSDYSAPDRQDRREKDSTPSFTDEVVDIATDHVLQTAMYAGLTYMATSHYGKLRIVGSVGLRLLPVVGVAAVAYGLYKLLDD